MSQGKESEVIKEATAIADIAKRISECDRFSMDIEFMSADRYIPNLALIQLSWNEGAELQLALIEGVDTELEPVFELVRSERVLTIAHGAKQDLSLLATRFQVKAGAFVDTQICAAFAGIGEQIGYANLVNTLLGKKLDKGSQFTNWMRRPLSDKQLRYALDDVRYLGLVWDKLKSQLDKKERLPWAKEESRQMALQAALPRVASEAYLRVGGAGSLKGRSLGSLRALATWRENLAVRENIPPSWILSDSAALDACRKKVRTDKQLKKVKGVPGSITEAYCQAILSAIEDGQEEVPVSLIPIKGSLDSGAQAQVLIVNALVAGRALALGMSQRAIGSKTDSEALVRKTRLGQGDSKLLHGWRYEVVGALAQAWLKGEVRILAHPLYGVSVEEPIKG